MKTIQFATFALGYHLIVGGVPVRQSEVVVEALDVEVREDELVLDHLPDDPRHLVAVHLHHGLGHLDALAGRI